MWDSSWNMREYYLAKPPNAFPTIARKSTPVSDSIAGGSPAANRVNSITDRSSPPTMTISLVFANGAAISAAIC